MSAPTKTPATAAGKPTPAPGATRSPQPTSGTARTQLRLVGYLRVSTMEQATHGYGLDSQKAAIRAAASATGARIVKWTTDAGVSGALPAEDRPGLTTALGYLREHKADGIIVRDMDRLARAVTVQEAVLTQVWNRLSGRVFTSTGEVQRDDPDDPMRTAMREMAGVFAGLERRMIVKRLRDGRATKAARGGHAVGAAPYGWDAIDGELTPNPAQQRALARMRELSSAGQSTRAIAEVLSDEGHPTKRGGRWSSPTVARILSRTTGSEIQPPPPSPSR